ncbi:hypothetical protein BIY29_14295 [Brenneria alni]|uniref:Uncharacterized protein n=1 Tax=Brenneria alni TaxID=71656 RepID=A0A421DLE6_9GAMM|nr:hypothetical protein BIY29_14295 [Brenneria alni]
MNKAVQLLYNALTSGGMLPTVALMWYRISIEDKQEHFFFTALTDATIVDIDCRNIKPRWLFVLILTVVRAITSFFLTKARGLLFFIPHQ